MRLVDEIEEVLVAHTVDMRHVGKLLRMAKAALLAGEEMAEHAGHDGCDEFHEALNRFRAATEETGKEVLHVGAAIGRAS